MKRCAAAELEVDRYHFRDRDGQKIDRIPQTPDGRVAGVEVKDSATVNVHDVRRLSFTRDRLGDQFVSGVVFLHCCPGIALGDRLTALPINLLWNGRSVYGL
ncbi:hypothetical protein H7H78_03520 [Mycobacterium shinjukuense]|nr:hypothetical protein [Mycobacterium shinjukuense]MCV6984543.1 hypothetical protein [Mycobacterium shinjukuense]ORB69253.1 hypothetical protein BST45_10000 [Mycobacterium shinjukuense]